MNPKKQVKTFEKQLRKEPSNVVVRLRLAGALVEAGRAAEAVEHYRLVAFDYHANGRLEQATAVCESILEIDPYHGPTVGLLTELQAKLATRAPAPEPEPEPEPAGRPRRYRRSSGYDLDRGSAPDFPPSGGSWTNDPSSGSGNPTGVRRTPLPVRSLAEMSGSRASDTGRQRRRGRSLSSAPPPLARPPAAAENRARGRRLDDLPLPAMPDERPSPAFRVPRPLKPPAPGRDKRATAASSPGPSGRASGADDGGPSSTGSGHQARDRSAVRRRSRGAVDDDAETRVADSFRAPPASSFAIRRAETASPEGDLVSETGERRVETGEVTIIDDGMALQRVLAPSVIAGKSGTPQLPMLAGLPERAVQAIATGMTRRLAAAGDLIVREGEAADAIFVVARGELRILKRDPLNPRGEVSEIGRLGEGALFGEIALLSDRRRNATVQAASAVEYYEIPRALIGRVTREVPEVDEFLSSFFRERLLANLMTASFFAPLGEAERAEVAKQFQLLRFAARAPVLSEGHRGGGFFLVLIGGVEITRALSHDRTVLLANLGEGTYFAEMSLLRGDLARASVTATRITELAVLPARNFYALVASHPMLWDQVRKEAKRRELDNVQMLAGTIASL